MNYRLFFLMGSIALAGCATTTRTVYDQPREEQPVAVTDRYEPVPGRGPDVIDPLRAAAAPEQPDIAPGKSPAADQDLLTPQSYVLVGNSRHARDDDAARRWIAEQGRAVGADKIRLYAQADAATTGDALAAAYFVHVRLVFGASFRDLNATERAAYPAGGVRLGDIVGASPASRANLRTGDLVTALDGRAVADRAAFQAMLKDRMGRTVALTVVRNGETIARKVQLGRTFAAQ